MKIKILALILLVNLSYATDANMSWVDKKINEIKPKRDGLDNKILSKLKNPFIVVKDTSKGIKRTIKSSKSTKKTVRQKSTRKSRLKLQMILNSSALINGKWLKENDVINGYKLTKIKNTYVVLKRKKRKIDLFITKKNKKLNIRTQ